MNSNTINGGFDFRPSIYKMTAKKLLEKPVNTVEAWIKVKTDGNPSENFGIIVSTYFYKDKPHFTLELKPGGIITLILCDKLYRLEGIDLRTDTYIHVAFVKDNAKKKLFCYLDGNLKQEWDCDMEDFLSVTNPTIGGHSKGTFYFRGTAYDVRLWSTARSEKQIKDNMYGIKDDKGGLLANWLLDDKTDMKDGSIYKDKSPYQNDAVLEVIMDLIDSVPPFDNDFTVVAIPDPQTITGGYTDISALHKMMEWIVDNTKKEKIAYTVNFGDVVNAVGDIPEAKVSEFKKAKKAFTILDEANIQYSIMPGNHDYDLCSEIKRNTILFNEYFPYEYYSKRSNFGGAYEEGSMDNNYCYFTAGGIKYLVLSLEFGPRDSVLEWCNKVVSENQDCRVIVVTHSHMYYDASFILEGDDNAPTNYKNGGYLDLPGDPPNDGVGMWEKFLKNHKNIFLALSGHIRTDVILKRTDIGVCGNEVHSIMANAQGLDFSVWRERPFGDIDGLGMLLLLRFSKNGSHVTVHYYSPYLKKYLGGKNIFSFDVKEYK